MHDWYIAAYSHLSNAVHSTAYDLQSYLRLGENDRIESLTFGPTEQDDEALLATAAGCLIRCQAATAAAFGMGVGEQFRDHDGAIAKAISVLSPEKGDA